MEIERGAASRNQARTDHRDTAFEAAAQLAVTLDRNSDRAERSGERNAAVGDVEDEVGQLERLIARRGHEFVDLAPAHLAVDQPAAKPHSASHDAIDLEAAVPFQLHLDDGVARNDIGPFRIADNEIADLLGPDADTVEVVAGLDAAPFEFLLEVMDRDRTPLDP